jgi:DNA-binding NarL/FixJ family response regulator
MGKLNYIAFVSMPTIIKEGIMTVLNPKKRNLKAYTFNNIQELNNYSNKSIFELIIINSDITGNEIKNINNLKSTIPNSKIIGIISNNPNRDFYSLLDNKIFLNDNSSKIVEIVELCLSNENKSNKKSFENKLSERETDVLKLLIQGKTNKEIADELFISIHTVISHRKNITTKLGIKSIAAMAIYAVANNIIDLNDNLNLFK